MRMVDVQRYAELMRKAKRGEPGGWDWSKMDSPIYIDPNDAIMGGHHRIIAAKLAGVEIPESAIVRRQKPTIRPTYDWDGNLID